MTQFTTANNSIYNSLMLVSSGSGFSTEAKKIDEYVSLFYLNYEFTKVRSFNYVKEKFDNLKAVWLRETYFSSNYQDIVNNNSYQQIISLGIDVVPFIFEDWQNSNSDWFFALRKILSENPVKVEHKGKFSLMKKDWMDWGKQNNFY